MSIGLHLYFRSPSIANHAAAITVHALREE
jgi:hypothetical protein